MTDRAFRCRWCGETFTNQSRLTLHSHSKHPERWSEDEEESGPKPTPSSKPSAGDAPAAPAAKPKREKSFVEWLWDGDDDEEDA